MKWHILCIGVYNQNMLNVERLQAALPILGLGHPLYFYSSIGSTNDLALEFAKAGSPHGTLVVTEEQTAGRGRAGRHWFTPPESALAFSLVVRLGEFEPEAIGELTVLGALAVAETLVNYGAEAWIKWPNDVLLAGRKVAGILVESSWMGEKAEFAVLGIGVNVRTKSVPLDGEVDIPATCVEAVIGKHVDRHQLLLEILEGVGNWLPKVGTQALFSAWNHRLTYRDQEVCVKLPQGQIYGRVQGLVAGGRLRLELEKGKTFDVSVGDVHLRPVDMNSK